MRRVLALRVILVVKVTGCSSIGTPFGLIQWSIQTDTSTVTKVIACGVKHARRLELYRGVSFALEQIQIEITTPAGAVKGQVVILAVKRTLDIHLIQNPR